MWVNNHCRERRGIRANCVMRAEPITVLSLNRLLRPHVKSLEKTRAFSITLRVSIPVAQESYFSRPSAVTMARRIGLNLHRTRAIERQSPFI